MLLFFSTKKSDRSVKKNAIWTLIGTSPSRLPRLSVDVSKILKTFIVTEKEENFKKKRFLFIENIMTNTVAEKSVALFEVEE